MNEGDIQIIADNVLDRLEGILGKNKNDGHLVIKKAGNGYIVNWYGDVIVFEDDEYGNSDGINKAAVSLLRWICNEYLGQEETGSKHSKKRVHINVVDHEDDRWEKIRRIVLSDDKVSKIWDIMEGE